MGILPHSESKRMQSLDPVHSENYRRELPRYTTQLLSVLNAHHITFFHDNIITVPFIPDNISLTKLLEKRGDMKKKNTAFFRSSR